MKDSKTRIGISLADRRPAPLASQIMAIIIGTLVATAANVIYYLLATGLFGIPMLALEQFPPPELSPIPVTDEVLFSFIFSFGAGVVLLIVANFTRRPAQVYLVITLIVLIISLFQPFMMPTPPIPLSTPVVLASMHILDAAVLVPILIGLGIPQDKNKQQSSLRDA